MIWCVYLVKALLHTAVGGKVLATALCFSLHRVKKKGRDIYPSSTHSSSVFLKREKKKKLQCAVRDSNPSQLLTHVMEGNYATPAPTALDESKVFLPSMSVGLGCSCMWQGIIGGYAKPVLTL